MLYISRDGKNTKEDYAAKIQEACSVSYFVRRNLKLSSIVWERNTLEVHVIKQEELEKECMGIE